MSDYEAKILREDFFDMLRHKKSTASSPLPPPPEPD